MKTSENPPDATVLDMVEQSHYDVLEGMRVTDAIPSSEELVLFVFAEMLRGLVPLTDLVEASIRPKDIEQANFRLVDILQRRFDSEFIFYPSKNLNNYSQYPVRLDSQALRSSDFWWTTPPYAISEGCAYPGLFTYSPIIFQFGQYLIPACDVFVEDSPFSLMERVTLYDNTVDSHTLTLNNMSVYSINDLSDFVKLVECFPFIRSDLDDETTINVVPDWIKIASHYDGVYLSPGAYISGAYIPCLVDDGITSMQGWAPATFYRLR